MHPQSRRHVALVAPSKWGAGYKPGSPLGPERYADNARIERGNVGRHAGRIGLRRVFDAVFRISTWTPAMLSELTCSLARDLGGNRDERRYGMANASASSSVST
jgi:hypothetical protein